MTTHGVLVYIAVMLTLSVLVQLAWWLSGPHAC